MTDQQTRTLADYPVGSRWLDSRGGVIVLTGADGDPYYPLEGFWEVLTRTQGRWTLSEAATWTRIDAPAPDALQGRVGDWLHRTFDAETISNRTERVMRFLEEAMELGQALGITAAQTAKIAEYVYGRPVGEPYQEVGGTMITLAALCHVFGLDMQAEGERELARIDTPEMRAKIAAKQISKRMFGMTHDTLEKPEPAPDALREAAERVVKTCIAHMEPFMPPEVWHEVCGLQAALAQSAPASEPTPPAFDERLWQAALAALPWALSDCAPLYSREEGLYTKASVRALMIADALLAAMGASDGQ